MGDDEFYAYHQNLMAQNARDEQQRSADRMAGYDSGAAGSFYIPPSSAGQEGYAQGKAMRDWFKSMEPQPWTPVGGSSRYYGGGGGGSYRPRRKTGLPGFLAAVGTLLIIFGALTIGGFLLSYGLPGLLQLAGYNVAVGTISTLQLVEGLVVMGAISGFFAAAQIGAGLLLRRLANRIQARRIQAAQPFDATKVKWEIPPYQPSAAPPPPSPGK